MLARLRERLTMVVCQTLSHTVDVAAARTRAYLSRVVSSQLKTGSNGNTRQGE